MKEDRYHKPRLANHVLHPETLMLGYGYDPLLSEGAVKPPVFLTSTFVFRSAEEGRDFFDYTAGRRQPPLGQSGGLVYSRFNHPNSEIVEDRLAAYEDAESCILFSSGMSAIATTILTFIRPGDVILHSQPLYGGTETLVSRTLTAYDVEAVGFADGVDETSMREAAETAEAKGRVSVIMIETPSNPLNTMVDIKLVSRIADDIESRQQHRPVIVCDNTLLGPILPASPPLRRRCIGVLAHEVRRRALRSDRRRGARRRAADEADQAAARRYRHTARPAFLLDDRPVARNARACAWSVATAMPRSLPSFCAIIPGWPRCTIYRSCLRMRRSGGSTRRSAPAPARPFHSISKGGLAEAFACLNRMQIFKLAVSLGGTESLACHPGSTTHSGVPAELRARIGVSDATIRLSIGIEHPDDLLADLSQALMTNVSPGAA